MKRVLAVLFLVLMVGCAYAAGTPEISGEKIVLAVENELNVDMGDGKFVVYYNDYVVKEFVEKTGVEVSIVPVHSDDNTTKRIEAMIQAGLMPNVYTDYSGRVGIFVSQEKYREHVMALDEYLPKETIDLYYPSYIELFSSGGHVRALPLTSWATVGHINLNAFTLAGMSEVLSDGKLLYSEVYEAAKKLKDQGYYATAMHANQDGGDYWIMTFWLSGFGARLYDENGNVALGTPEAVAALTTMKQWYDEGLIPFGAAGLGPGDYGNEVNSGSCLAYSYGHNPREVNGFINIQTETPRVEGVEKVPVAVGPDAVLAFDTGSKAQKYAAATLVAHIASARYQQFQVDWRMRFPSMYGITLPGGGDGNFDIAVDVLERNGVLDIGIGTPYYKEMRTKWASMIQAILSEELTVEAAIDRYVEEGTKIIEASRQ